MAKRMIGMLAVTLALVAALGFVKFKQIQTAIAQGAASTVRMGEAILEKLK